MNKLSLTTLAITLLAASVPVAQPVQASAGIQRCERNDGSVIYTDQACAAFRAHAVPMAGEVLTRIMRDELRRQEAPDNLAALDANSVEPAVSRRSAQAGCAHSPTQLAMDLQSSVMIGDVNRVAESYHWVGLSHRQSKPVMQRLERMTRQTLIDVDYFDATLGDNALYADAGNDAAPTGNGPSGVMQLMFGGDAVQVVDLEVTRYAGCYFVRF